MTLGTIRVTIHVLRLMISCAKSSEAYHAADVQAKVLTRLVDQVSESFNSLPSPVFCYLLKIPFFTHSHCYFCLSSLPFSPPNAFRRVRSLQKSRFKRHQHARQTSSSLFPLVGS